MLKKSSLTFIILLLACLGGIARQQQNPQLIFDKANQQLQKGQTRRALAGYKKLEARNQISGALFLNLGLSYIRLDSMGRAKYFFLKAQKFDETRTRAARGLTYVNNQFSRQSVVLPVLPWQRVIHWLGNRLGVDALLALGLLLLNMGVILYLIFWFKNRLQSTVRIATLTAAVIGLFIILLGFFINYRQHRYHQAVMIDQQTTVKTKPAPDAELVSQAFEGYTFRVDLSKSKRHTGWAYVRMSNGQYGWIPRDEILIL